MYLSLYDELVYRLRFVLCKFTNFQITWIAKKKQNGKSKKISVAYFKQSLFYKQNMIAMLHHFCST